MPTPSGGEASAKQPSKTVAPLAHPLSLAFDRTPHGVIVSDEDGTILYANPLAAAMFKQPTDALIGQPLSRFLTRSTGAMHPDPWAEFWADVQRPLATTSSSVTGLRADGTTIPLEVNINLLMDRTRRHAVAALTDVSERLDLEARLAAATHAHLGFQRLVSEIAGRFVRVDPELVDETITDSLRQIGEALQLDRAVLWRHRRGEPTAIATHNWQPHRSVPLPPLPVDSIPWVMSRLESGEAAWFSNVEEVPESVDRETFRTRGPMSGAAVPLASTEQARGELWALAFSSMTEEREWPAPIIERLRLVANVMGQALARRASQAALQAALDEIQQLRERVMSEDVEQRREIRTLPTSLPIVSDSAQMQSVLAQIQQVAPTPATVLLLGETGTGKEIMAQAIHDLSPRHQRPMIRVSCAAIPSALIESELFGRERGAYTGALSRQIGRFEAANQSTLFLDEIGDLPMDVQVKLLRVLQERVIERLGSTQPIKVDVRIIAATNCNLEDAVRNKTFREDLFYRLNVFPIVVPPLRDRVEDIPGLAWSFIDEFSRSFGKPIESISRESMRDLQRYPWPGNVRELRNVIERAVIVATSRVLVVPAPRLNDRTVPQSAMTLSALEVEHIRAVLEATKWRVRGPGGAAERLGLKPTTLESRMARLGLARKKTG